MRNTVLPGGAPKILPVHRKFENNILLTQTERLTMTGRPKTPRRPRNKNVLVIGRKQRLESILQCFPTSDYPTSFVVTDPVWHTLVLKQAKCSSGHTG